MPIKLPTPPEVPVITDFKTAQEAQVKMSKYIQELLKELELKINP